MEKSFQCYYENLGNWRAGATILPPAPSIFVFSPKTKISC